MPQDITAQVQGMQSSPEGTTVTVKVNKLKALPSRAAEFRARARAVIASGPAANAKDTIEEVTSEEVKGITSVEGEPKKIKEGRFNEVIEYEIKVNRDNAIMEV